MVAKKKAEAEEPEEAVEDQPVPEIRHPSAPNYVLRDDQWVYEEQAEVEPEPENPEE